MMDGVPTGDCRVPAPPPAGCPAAPPKPGSSCEAPNGLLQCPYDIYVEAGRASQRVFICHPAELVWGELDELCGTSCGPLGSSVIELAAPCGAEPLTTCKDSGTVFAFETAQQWLDSKFMSVLMSCLGERRFDRQLRLELQDGCPSRLSSSAPFSDADVQCLSSALNGAHWDCARELSCSEISEYFL